MRYYNLLLQAIKTIIFFFIIFFSHYSSVSQDKEMIFEHLSIEDGLSQSTVNCIMQDSKGFMWFGTDAGLNKYGGSFKIYKNDHENPNSLCSGYILCLYEDKQGNIWIGSHEGLNKFDAKYDKFYSYRHNPENTNSLSNNIVRSIYQDNTGMLWIGTDGGIDRFDIINNKFTHLPVDLQDSVHTGTGGINSIYKDSFGDIWIGSVYGGLLKYIPDNNAFISYKNDPENPQSISNNYVKSIIEDNSGTLWIGTYGGGLNKFDRENNNFYCYKNDPDDPYSLSENKIWSIFSDEDDILWIGTFGGGLNRFDKKTGKFIIYRNDMSDENSLIDNNILSVYRDKTGVLWIGTNARGISKYDIFKRKFTHFKFEPQNPNSLNDNEIWSVFEDSKATIWIGTDVGGLNEFNYETGIFKYHLNRPEKSGTINSNCVMSIREDKTGNLWLATYDGGLNKYEREKGIFKHFNNKLNTGNNYRRNTLRVLMIDHKGLLWVGTYTGLYWFDIGNEEFSHCREDYKHPDNLSQNQIKSIYEDKEGIVWIGTNTGLYRYNRDTKNYKHFSYDPEKPNSLNNNEIYSIYESKKGELWIGTNGGGLNKYIKEDETFIYYTEKHGLPNDVINGILEDNEGNLWLSTNKGLSIFNPETIEFKNFDFNDGLQSNEFNVGSCYKGNSGRMYFGGINGFNSFYPDKIKSNPYIPEIVFTDFQLFNKTVKTGDNSLLKKSIAFTDTIILSYKDYVFSFKFAALHYSSPNKNQYAYMMEGYDEAWINIGTRRYVPYTSLPYGEYNFKVKGSNCDNIWNENGASIHLIITPPFWKTKWFYALVILFLIVGVIFYIKWRERTLQRDKKILEQTVEERTIEVVLQKEHIEEKNEELKELVEKISVQKDVITEQRDQVLQQKKELTDSINYASKIQTAVLPSQKKVDEILPEHFIMFKPRDIVSGDFYWLQKVNKYIIIAVADCTGHGVPGAFMSMLGITFLNEIISKKDIIQPNQALEELRKQVKLSLQQIPDDHLAHTDIDLYMNTNVKDGLDIALCVIDTELKTLDYSGANNPVYLMQNNRILELHPTKNPIGIYIHEIPFKNQQIKLSGDESLYLFTDGYIDQFGGENGSKFYSKRFSELLFDIHKKPMTEQKEILEKTFTEWKGSHKQIDDILVIGMRVKSWERLDD